MCIRDRSGTSLGELTVGSGYTTGLSFATLADFGAFFLSSYNGAMALDAAGDIFVSSSTHDGVGGVLELFGLAKPVLTPVQACLQKGKNVCLP